MNLLTAYSWLVIISLFPIVSAIKSPKSASIVDVKIECKDLDCKKSVLVINKKGTKKQLIPPIKMNKKDETSPNIRTGCNQVRLALEPTLESIQRNEIVALEKCNGIVTRGVVTSGNVTIQLKPDPKTKFTKAITTEYTSDKIFAFDSVKIDEELIEKSREMKRARTKFSPRKSISGIFEIEILALVDSMSVRKYLDGDLYNDDFVRQNIESSFAVVQKLYNGTGYRPILKNITFLEDEKYCLGEAWMNLSYHSFMAKTTNWQKEIPAWNYYDLILWFTYKEEDDEVLGIAGQSSICSIYSAGLIQLAKKTTAFLITHEVGHPLTLYHDNGEETHCNDPDSIMYDEYSTFKYWSNCSMESFQKLKNNTSKSFCLTRTDVKI